MVKHRKIVAYYLDRYPKYCKECPAFSCSPYRCHNEVGMVADCELGYMAGRDMRDFTGTWLFDDCRIWRDNRVTVKSEPEDGE